MSDLRIVVVSDTHVPQFARRFDALLARVRDERPAAILHCGDFTSFAIVAAFEAIAPFDAVAGNNDGDDIERRFGRSKVLAFGAHRIGLVHGDGTRGTTRDRALRTFADAAPHVVLFGHSHVPICERIGTMWLINPGSGTDKRREPRFSYATLDLSDERCDPRLRYFD